MSTELQIDDQLIVTVLLPLSGGIGIVRKMRTKSGIPLTFHDLRRS
jgi:hypothetical protein